MSEVESFHEVGDEEIQFKEDDPRVGSPTPPIPITAIDMEVLIRGWEEKFERMSRCLRKSAVGFGESQLRHVRHQQGSARTRERAGAALGGNARGAHGVPAEMWPCAPPNYAPTASTPYTQSTPTGMPARLRPEFEFQPSPVGQDEPMEPTRSTMSHIRDHDDIRSARTRDHDDIRNMRIREHDAFKDTRTREHIDDRDARTRDLHDNRDRLNERPTHKMTGEIAVTCSGILIIVEWTHQCHARPQAPKFRRSMERYQLNSVHGLSSSRPLRATRVGH